MYHGGLPRFLALVTWKDVVLYAFVPSIVSKVDIARDNEKKIAVGRELHSGRLLGRY